MIALKAALFAVSFSVALAAQDSNFYPEGYENPASKDAMYWGDSGNVLNDLSLFSKLYVTYQNCAWSPYETGEENPCGIAESDNSNYWYMGNTECFRANAAFSLYGIMAGAEDIGCTRSTFINSFYTTQGVEYFTQAMEAAGYYFTQNQNYYNEDNNNNNEGENGEKNNYAFPSGVSSQCVAGDADNNGARLSYGLGCSSRRFAKKTFNGAYCEKNQAVRETDDLSTFNKDISNARCISIYDSSHGNNAQNGDDGDGDAIDLLYASRSCNVRESPLTCPDPHGKLRTYAEANERAHAWASHPRRERIKRAFAWIFIFFGVFFIGFAIFVCLRRRRRAQKARTGVNNKNKRNQQANSNKSVSTAGTTASTTTRTKKPWWRRFRRN